MGSRPCSVVGPSDTHTLSQSYTSSTARLDAIADSFSHAVADSKAIAYVHTEPLTDPKSITFAYASSHRIGKQPAAAYIWRPSEGVTVDGTYWVKVYAADDKAVLEVELSLNGGAGYANITPYKEDPVTYVWDWKSNAVPNGKYTMMARVTNNEGAMTQTKPLRVTLSNTPRPRALGPVSVAPSLKGPRILGQHRRYVGASPARTVSSSSRRGACAKLR